MCTEIYIIVFMCSPDIAHYCHIVCKTSPSILPYPYQCHKEDLLLILAYLVTGICNYYYPVLYIVLSGLQGTLDTRDWHHQCFHCVGHSLDTTAVSCAAVHQSEASILPPATWYQGLALL